MPDQEKQQVEDLEPKKDAKGGARNLDAANPDGTSLDRASLDGGGKTLDGASLDRSINKSLD